MIINKIISTIFLIYRRFDMEYRLTDKNWQKNHPYFITCL